MTRPQTLRELLESTIRDDRLRLGNGHEATTYRFAEKELAPYVLRVQHEVDTPAGMHELKTLLQNSTALVPVETLLTGAHLGQPLFRLDNGDTVSILLRQEGVSLQHVKDADRKARITEDTAGRRILAEHESTVALMARILHDAQTHDYNPFLPIFRTGYEMAKLGYMPDFRPNNLLFDPKAKKMEFRLVDQLGLPAFKFPAPEEANASNLANFTSGVNDMFTEFRINPARSSREDLETFTDFMNLITDAKEQVIEEQKAQSPLESKLRFKTVTQTQGVGLDERGGIRKLQQQLATMLPDIALAR